MTATQASTTVAADCINFIHENNTGRIAFSFFKQVSNTTGADTHKHFYELRT